MVKKCFFKLLFDYSFVRGTSGAMASLSGKIPSSSFALCSVIFILHAVKSGHFSSSLQTGKNWVYHSSLNGKMPSKLAKQSLPSAERGGQSWAARSYEQPTIASKSRSPSPYTKRRMCELSEEARQRLAHLNLGPHEFRRDTDKPPFVIRRVCIHSKLKLGSNVVLSLKSAPKISFRS